MHKQRIISTFLLTSLSYGVSTSQGYKCEIVHIQNLVKHHAENMKGNTAFCEGHVNVFRNYSNAFMRHSNILIYLTVQSLRKDCDAAIDWRWKILNSFCS